VRHSAEKIIQKGVQTSAAISGLLKQAPPMVFVNQAPTVDLSRLSIAEIESLRGMQAALSRCFLA
jgi:hypothetical protein